MDVQHTDTAGVAVEAVSPVEAVSALGTPAEPGTSWREALSAWVQPRDHQVSDEDIFAILNGGSDGVTADDMCAALGVTLPMYCVWKSKYRKLDLDQIRDARRRERRRRHTGIGAAALITVLLTAGIGATLLRAIAGQQPNRPTGQQANGPSALKTIPVSAVRRPTAVPAAAPEVRTSDRRSVPAAVPAPPSPQALRPSSPHAKPSSPQDPGYGIQVTAAETEPQGRALVAQLTSQGYPAYMQQAVVGNREVFRVRVGPFDTEAAARGMATQLKAAGYAGVWLVR